MLDKVPAFKEDFFERVVDVKWETTLAVEFGNRAEDAPGKFKTVPEKQG